MGTVGVWLLLRFFRIEVADEDDVVLCLRELLFEDFFNFREFLFDCLRFNNTLSSPLESDDPMVEILILGIRTNITISGHGKG